METEKFDHNQQPSYPLAPPHTYIRSDESLAEEELRRKKRRKRILYISAFVVFQTVVVLVFALVVLRFKTPKFRLRAASFTSFQVGNSSNPSLNLRLNAQFTVRNRNYGRFKYEYGSVVFSYRGLTLGQGFIDDARVRARSTKKVNATVVLNSAGLGGQAEFDDLGRDIGAGVLTLTGYSELEGKIQVIKVIKKKKSAKLNCTMDVIIATRTIQNLKCL
ncbi:Late embryogenesis abundant protein [Trema orientale]|uniref:Late embryogenesis abundant protein n=1 Tax=Trema orientale TaxID=63057 RepID=A0A2P5FGM2_TREOI|nr:Late embryogenesis abundant protein [Trema orientale]